VRLDQALDLIAEVHAQGGRFRLDSDGGWELQVDTPLSPELVQRLDDLRGAIGSGLLLAGEDLEVESPLVDAQAVRS